MNRSMLLPLILAVLWTPFIHIYAADNDSRDFFKIQAIDFYAKQPQKGIATFKEVEVPNKPKEKIFLPFVSASVMAMEQAASMNVIAKAYFYNKDRALIATVKEPTPVDRGEGLLAMPALLPKAKEVAICFAVPKEVFVSSGWYVVVVFGDKDGAIASVYPKGGGLTAKSFTFPERDIVDNPASVEREKADNPLVEHVVKTGVEAQPKITLFLRRPIGMTDFSDAKGVLALCILANGVADIKKRLQEADEKDELKGVLRFAEQHNLAILCWGSRSLWNPRANWDEMKKQEDAKIDMTFDIAAKAWAKGVEELSAKYGIPKKNFLLWGVSGSAQYAARLALRQPQYFLAVHVHIPSSFDEPTPEANRILWCLTTGEEESGYDRSLKFLDACRKLGYPIVYKAIPGLGHSGHPIADKLGLAFFEYALTLQDEKGRFEADFNKLASEAKAKAKKDYQPWPESFKRPAFIGDIFRQEIYPSAQVPNEPGVRTPLPIQQIAEAWNGKK